MSTKQLAAIKKERLEEIKARHKNTVGDVAILIQEVEARRAEVTDLVAGADADAYYMGRLQIELKKSTNSELLALRNNEGLRTENHKLKAAVEKLTGEFKTTQKDYACSRCGHTMQVTQTKPKSLSEE